MLLRACMVTAMIVCAGCGDPGTGQPNTTVAQVQLAKPKDPEQGLSPVDYEVLKAVIRHFSVQLDEDRVLTPQDTLGGDYLNNLTDDVVVLKLEQIGLASRDFRLRIREAKIDHSRLQMEGIRIEVLHKAADSGSAINMHFAAPVFTVDGKAFVYLFCGHGQAGSERITTVRQIDGDWRVVNDTRLAIR